MSRLKLIYISGNRHKTYRFMTYDKEICKKYVLMTPEYTFSIQVISRKLNLYLNDNPDDKFQAYHFLTIPRMSALPDNKIFA